MRRERQRTTASSGAPEKPKPRDGYNESDFFLVTADNEGNPIKPYWAAIPRLCEVCHDYAKYGYEGGWFCDGHWIEMHSHGPDTLNVFLRRRNTVELPHDGPHPAMDGPSAVVLKANN